MLEGAADGHVFGGGEVDEPKPVIIRQLVGAETSYRRFKCLLLSDLSIKIHYDNFDIVLWAAFVLPLQQRIEVVFIVIGALKMRNMHSYNAQVEEPATNPQPAHPLIDRPPPDHSFPHLTYDQERRTEFMFFTTTLVDHAITAIRAFRHSFPAHFLKCYYSEATGPHLVRKKAGTSSCCEGPAVPCPEFPIVSLVRLRGSVSFSPVRNLLVTFLCIWGFLGVACKASPPTSCIVEGLTHP